MNTMVSIIMPVYNRYDLIGETLDTVLNQTYLNWECVVVDDRSDDYISELMEFYCERDPRIRFFNRPEHLVKGTSSCRNYAFQQSRGGYINFFDSDDLMKKDLLEKKMNLLKTSNADYCLCNMKVFLMKDGKMEFIHTTNAKFNNLWEDFVMRKFAAGTPSVLWKKEVLLDQEYLFDEKLTHSEDLDLCNRIFFKNKNIVVLPEPLILIRSHAVSMSGEFFTGSHLASFLRVRQRILNLAGNNKEIERYTLISVLDTFRSYLCQKNYKGCEECLSFIDANNKHQSLLFWLSLMRVRVFYKIFKRAGRGETRFRRLLKIK